VRQNPSRLRRFLARFARARQGVTAVEFALVSLPMLVLTFGVLELAIVFIVTTTLDNATEGASRQIRTGQFQTGGTVTPAAFKALVCSNMTWLSSKCASDLWLDVRTFSNFNGLATAPPLPLTAFTTNPSSGTCFSPGQPTDIVLVRAYFQWDLFTPLLNAALENMGGGSGKRLITSATAFRNEPYNNNPAQGASTCP
jgi:Flp pilus assembly protein TadG